MFWEGEASPNVGGLLPDLGRMTMGRWQPTRFVSSGVSAVNNHDVRIVRKQVARVASPVLIVSSLALLAANPRAEADGEVAKAGLYPVTANATLLDVIAMAGGFRSIADQNKVYVFREIGGRKLVANYSVAEIRSGRLGNPRIYGGDVVMVFTSQSRVAMNNLKEALGMAANASRLAVIP